LFPILNHIKNSKKIHKKIHIIIPNIHAIVANTSKKLDFSQLSFPDQSLGSLMIGSLISDGIFSTHP
jgi:hypothetical protein